MTAHSKPGHIQCALLHRELLHRELLHRELPTNKTELKVLFPFLQLSIMTSLLLVLLAPTGWVKGVYCTTLLLWQVMLTARFSSYFSNRHQRICTSQTAMTLLVACWHGLLGLALHIPFATAVMTLTVITVTLFGWICHESR